MKNEKKFDDKLMVFRVSILEELRKEIRVVAEDSIAKYSTVNSNLTNFTIDTQKTIKESQTIREIFEKDANSKIEYLLKEKNSIDFTGCTESLEYETKERKEESIKLQVGIQRNKEAVESLDDKIRCQLTTNIQKIPSLYEAESPDLNKARIKELENQIKARDQEIEKMRTIIKSQEERIRNHDNNVTANNINLPLFNQSNRVHENSSKIQAEILMIFDSNGKYLDRKKLWKLDNSISKRCGNLYEVYIQLTKII